MEADLLNRIALGDQKAFRQIFHTYYPLLSTHIYHLTRSLEVTEDIVQDVFLKIWISREALTGVQDFRSYLWVMSRNTALNALHKAARERANRLKYVSQNAPLEVEPSNESPFVTLLDQAIEGLPPQQRKVFVLSRHHRLKQAEIAAELGITVSTVKKYMQLAMEFITKYIKDRYAYVVMIFFTSFF